MSKSASLDALRETYHNKLLAEEVPGQHRGSSRKDHFVRRNGSLYAGSHILLDLWGGLPLNDLDFMDNTMRQAVSSCGATLLHLHLHRFSSGGGISGVAVLAESHISVHTWPEREFAAFDIFMCGLAQPKNAVQVFERAFSPQRTEIIQHSRGQVSE